MKKILLLNTILLAGTLLYHDGMCGPGKVGYTNPGFQDEESQSLVGGARKDSSSSKNAPWKDNERQPLLPPGPKKSSGVVKIFRNRDKKILKQTVHPLFSQKFSGEKRVLKALAKRPDALEKLEYMPTVLGFFEGDTAKEEGLMVALDISPADLKKITTNAVPLFHLFASVENRAKEMLLWEWSTMSSETLDQSVKAVQRAFQWIKSGFYSGDPQKIQMILPLLDLRIVDCRQAREVAPVLDFRAIVQLSQDPNGIDDFEKICKHMNQDQKVRESYYGGEIARALATLEPQYRRQWVDAALTEKNVGALFLQVTPDVPSAS